MTVNTIGASLQTLYIVAFIIYSQEKVLPSLCVSLVSPHTS